MLVRETLEDLLYLCITVIQVFLPLVLLVWSVGDSDVLSGTSTAFMESYLQPLTFMKIQLKQ